MLRFFSVNMFAIHLLDVHFIDDMQILHWTGRGNLPTSMTKKKKRKQFKKKKISSVV